MFSFHSFRVLLVLQNFAKMNDLMTKSFQSYAELKKQAEKDNLEDSHDIEAGKLNNPTDYHNLSQFFQEVEAIKVEMEEVATLLFDLLQLHEETKCTDSAKVLRGLRDRMVSDMVTLFCKARIINSRFEVLDQSNITNHTLSESCKEGIQIDDQNVCHKSFCWPGSCGQCW